MAFFGCNLLGRAEGRSGAGGAVGGEELGDLKVAGKARGEQRRGAVVAGLADRRAGLEEQLGALEVALVARGEQRRGAVLLGLVGRRASLEEQPGALNLPLLACDVQRGSAAASPSPPAARRSGVGSPSCKLAPLRRREVARAAVRVSRCASGVQPRLATSQAARSACSKRFAISSGVPKGGTAAREAP